MIQPIIIIFDSLGWPHPQTLELLKDYVTKEAKEKKRANLTDVPAGIVAKGISQQKNGYDCGAFLLGYVDEFIKDPDRATQEILLKKELGWDIDPVGVRTRLKALIFELKSEQLKQQVA